MFTARAALAAAALVLLAAACGARTTLVPRPFGDDGDGGAGGQGGAGGSGSASVSTSVSSAAVTTSGAVTSTGVGGNANDVDVVSVAPDSIFEAETTIAAATNGLVAASWIAIGLDGSPGIAYTFSKDEGQSWNAPVTIAPVEGRIASDPVLAVDAEDRFFLTWVGFRVDMNGEPFDMRVFVARADPFEPGFGTPVMVSDPASSAIVDKPWITVTDAGTVVVSYASFDGTSSLVAARSVDGGQSFARGAIVTSDVTFYNLAFLCANAAEGSLFATYVGLDFMGNAAIFASRSDDDGVSFQPPVAVSSEPAVAFTDPSCVAAGQDVWVAYGTTPDPVGGRSGETAKLDAIRLARSTDGAQSFPLVVSVQDSGAATYFMLPQLTREESGALDLTYYAGDFDEDEKGSFRRARAPSADGIFGASVPLYEPLTFLQSRSDVRWLGDYTGLFAGNGRLFSAFAINDTGLSHVGVSVVPLP